MFTERSNKNQERLPYDDILVFKDIVSIFQIRVINALVLLTINSLFILDSPNLLFIVYFTWIYIVIVNNFRIQVFGVLNAIIYQMTFPYSTNATILNTQQSSQRNANRKFVWLLFLIVSMLNVVFFCSVAVLHAGKCLPEMLIGLLISFRSTHRFYFSSLSHYSCCLE